MTFQFLTRNYWRRWQERKDTVRRRWRNTLEKLHKLWIVPLCHIPGGNIPIEQGIAMKQFEFIKNKADAGESFVIVGRCADEILPYNP